MEIEVQLIDAALEGIGNEEQSIWKIGKADVALIPVTGDIIEIESGRTFEVTGRRFQWLTDAEEPRMIVHVICKTT